MVELAFVAPADWVCDAMPWEATAILGAAAVLVIFLGADWPAKK